jgi:hypothetical protein
MISATTSLIKHGKEKVEIDPNASTNIILATRGSKCQAHKMSHNLGTPEVPHPHYQCNDNIQLHHQLAHE